MIRTIREDTLQRFTAAVADARAEGLEVTVTRTSPPFEAEAEGDGD